MTDQNTAEVIEIDPVLAAFKAGIQSDDFDDDAVKMAMINAGAKFSNVNKLFRQFSIDAGLDMSRKDRQEKVAAIAEGYDLEDEDTVEQLTQEIQNQIPGMTPQRAAAALKTYAKKNGLKIFARPKGSGPRTAFFDKFVAWMMAWPEGLPSKEEAEAYINENGTANAIKRIDKTMLYWDVAVRGYQKAQ